MKNLFPTIVIIVSIIGIIFLDLFICHTTTGTSEIQLFLGLICCITPVLTLILIRDVVGSIYKSINYTVMLLTFITGVFMIYDMKHRPCRHSDYKELFTICETKNIIIIETDTSKTKSNIKYFSYCNSNEIKFDSIHPLKAYEAYRIDIFSNRTSGRFCVKSDLMKDYVFPRFINNDNN